MGLGGGACECYVTFMVGYSDWREVLSVGVLALKKMGQDKTRGNRFLLLFRLSERDATH